MNNGTISQKEFNRICSQIQNADMILPKTDIRNLTASFITLQDEAMMDILEKVFIYAVAVADKKHVVPADAINFAARFRELWIRVSPDQGDREQYARAIQPFIDRDIMTELFWSEEFSIVRFRNNAFGIFKCMPEYGCWHGKILDEAVLTSVAAAYVKYHDAYRQYRILDEAGLGLKHFGDLDKVLHPEYTETVMVYSSLTECDEETIIHPNIGPLYAPRIRVVPGYSVTDFADVIRSVIAYNMKEDQKSAAYTYLKLKDEMRLFNYTRLVLSHESIRFVGHVVVKQLSDMEQLGQYPDSDGEQLKQLQAEYHHAELEQMARIKAQQEKTARIEAYWSAHPVEKEKLEREEKQCREELSTLSERLRLYYQERRSIENSFTESQSSEVERLSAEISRLSYSIHGISFLHRKERKAIRNKIENMKAERKAIEARQKNVEPSLKARKEYKLQKLEAIWKPDLEREEQLNQRLSVIVAEKTKDRP